MANNRFNKQVSPKGYADGGTVKKKKAPKAGFKNPFAGTSIKEKILPNKKKKRLEELREQLK